MESIVFLQLLLALSPCVFQGVPFAPKKMDNLMWGRNTALLTFVLNVCVCIRGEVLKQTLDIYTFTKKHKAQDKNQSRGPSKFERKSKRYEIENNPQAGSVAGKACLQAILHGTEIYDTNLKQTKTNKSFCGRVERFGVKFLNRLRVKRKTKIM